MGDPAAEAQVKAARAEVMRVLSALDPSVQREVLAGESATMELRDKQFQDSIRSRIDMVKDATTRSRYVLIVSAVLSSAMALVLYNFTLSWVHSIALDPTVFDAQHKIRTDLQKMLLEQWVSSHVFSVPVLGIKVMASDIAIIGPPALLFVGLWGFFAVRREHFTTARLLADVYQHYHGPTPPDPVTRVFCQFVLYAVYAQNLFTVARTDKPIGKLDHRDDEVEDPEFILSWGERAWQFGRSLRRPDRFSSLVRAGFNLLSYLPSLAILAILFMRLITFFWVLSPFRDPPSIHSFRDTQPVLTTFMLVTSALCFVVSNRFAKSIMRFDVATRNVMIAFRAWALQIGADPAGSPAAPAPRDLLYDGPGSLPRAWAPGAVILIVVFVTLAVAAAIAPGFIPRQGQVLACVVSALLWGAALLQQRYRRYRVRGAEIEVTQGWWRSTRYNVADFDVRASPDGRALTLVKPGEEVVTLAIPCARLLAYHIGEKREATGAAPATPATPATKVA